MSSLLITGGVVPSSALSASAVQRALRAAPFADAPDDSSGDVGLRRSTIVLQSGQIAAVEPQAPAPENGTAQNSPPDNTQFDAEGCTILPGFVDVHVHGGMGCDTMDATPEAIQRMSHFHAQHGTTALLPTTMTGPASETQAAVEAVTAFLASSDKTTAADEKPDAGARVLGVHLEGPFISPEFPGAQPAIHIRPPDLEEFARLVEAGPVRMMTLAPEQPGALGLIDVATRRGVVTVLGHTNASYAECQAAVLHGLSQATHTYNAMRGLHHREPGALGAVLSDARIDAQLIADNVHVHPAAMNILARCKGAARTLLITDAMRAAGLPPGEYTLGGQPVTMQNGECRLADGTLAGSVLTMERALKNFVAATGWTLAQAWPVSSYVPARTLGLHQKFGLISPGYAADLVVLDAELDVVATIVDGRIVYLRDPERLRR